MIRQNEYGKLKRAVSFPIIAGAVHTLIFEAVLSEGFDASDDIFEIGALHANCKIVGYDLLSANLAGTNLITVGFMSGGIGETHAARTCGNELFDGVTRNTAHEATLAQVVDMPAQDNTVAIGVKLSVDETAAANKRIMLRLHYQA